MASIYGPSAPYISPSMLVQSAVGIAWSTFPSREATDAQKYAAQLNLCARATQMVDLRLNYPLRATVATEQLVGPGTFQVQLRPDNTVWLLCSRAPITSVVGGRVSASSAFPPSWQTVAANQFRIDNPPAGLSGSTAPGAAGDGGQSIIMAPGWVTWWAGRGSVLVEPTYTHGWPHASLTAAAAEGATSLAVDDITMWTGAAGVLYDTFQEMVTVTAVTPDVTDAISGPGTLTLASALTGPHAVGTLLSTLPANAQQATVYLALSLALTRGATSTSTQTISGSTTGGGAQGSVDYVKMAYEMIDAFSRVI